MKNKPDQKVWNLLLRCAAGNETKGCSRDLPQCATQQPEPPAAGRD